MKNKKSDLLKAIEINLKIESVQEWIANMRYNALVNKNRENARMLDKRGFL